MRLPWSFRPLEADLDIFIRLQLFRTRVAKLFATTLQDEEQIFLTEFVQMINEGLPAEQLFGTAEATAQCAAMTATNDLLLSEGIVYKI